MKTRTVTAICIATSLTACAGTAPKQSDVGRAAQKTSTAAPAPSVGASGSAVGKSCNPCSVKSLDGSFEGDVYGRIPPGSKWSKLRIGMEQAEVEKLIGVSRQVYSYPTGKGFIPFYFGADKTRYEVSYPGQGSVSYAGGGIWGAGRGVLLMINYDPSR